MKSFQLLSVWFAKVVLFLVAFGCSHLLMAQSEGYNKTINLDNFTSINTTINENCFNKIGREFFLLEIDIQDSKFFPPSMQLSQSVFKTKEIIAIEDLEVEEFYYLLNHEFVYTGPVVSYNLKDYIFSATKRHGDGVIKSGQTLQLYTANIDDEYFTNIKRLPFCDKSSNYCHASIRANGNLLIFASDMPGGHGGYDLYAAARVNGVWSKPYNLGPKINSIDDELYPFFSDDGYLYFSSDRFGGIGETDIYVSERLDDGWTAAANLGAPYNSKSHDYGFRLLNYEGYGTLSSDRSGGLGIDDIYTFRHFREEENKDLINAQENEIDAEVVSNENSKSITTNVVNNYFNFQSPEAAKVMDREAYVIFYDAPEVLDVAAYNRDKDAYIKQLPVANAKKLKVEDLSNISPAEGQFVQIKVKGFNDIYLSPKESAQQPFNFDFIAKGWKPLPGLIIYNDGIPVEDISIDLNSLDGQSKISAKSDEHGRFSSRVMTDKIYEVRLYSEGIQVLETFEFDPENFDQLIIDMTVSQAYQQRVLDAIKRIPELNANTNDLPLSKEPEIVQVKSEVAPIVEEEVVPEVSTQTEEFVDINEEPITADDVVVAPEDRGYSGDETGHFYIIAGTFSAEYRARRRLDLVKAAGFQSAQLIKVVGTDYFKVSVNDFEELDPAQVKESAVRPTVDDVYILRKEPVDIQIVE